MSAAVGRMVECGFAKSFSGVFASRSGEMRDTFSFFLSLSGWPGFAAMIFFIAPRSLVSMPPANVATLGSSFASSRMATAPGDTMGAFRSTAGSLAIRLNSVAGSPLPANLSFKKVHDRDTHKRIARTGRIIVEFFIFVLDYGHDKSGAG